jgi:hypothetical protein
MYRRRRNLVNNKNKQAKEKFYLSDLKTVNSKLYYKLLICYSKDLSPLSNNGIINAIFQLLGNILH